LNIVSKFRDNIDAIGMIVGNTRSKRRISLETSREIVKKSELPVIAVSTDQSYEEWIEIIGIAPDGIQFHGNIGPKDVEKIREKYSGFVLKVFEVERSVEDPFDESDRILNSMEEYDADAFLLDTKGGGTGVKHDQRVSERVIHEAKRPIILAGGINAENVSEFLKADPFGIDISSGVETNGIKDERRIRSLLEHVYGI